MHKFIDGVVTRNPALVSGTADGQRVEAIHDLHDLAKGWAEVMRRREGGGELMHRKDGGLCLVGASEVLWLTTGGADAAEKSVDWGEVAAFLDTLKAGRAAASKIRKDGGAGSGIGVDLCWSTLGSPIVETMWCETADLATARQMVEMFGALAGVAREDHPDGCTVDLSDGLEGVTMSAGPRTTRSPTVERLDNTICEVKSLGQGEGVFGAPLVVAIDGDGGETVVWHRSTSSALAAVRSAARSAGGTTRFVGWDLEGVAGDQRWTTVLPSVVERWVKLFRDLLGGSGEIR